MPIRIKSKTRYQDSVTPANLNIETNIVNIAEQTDDYIIEGQISLENMQAGDSVLLQAYISVDGVNQRLADPQTFSGVQSVPLVRVPAHTIAYNGLFKVTVKQTGGTVRAFKYTFIMEVMEAI
jgi:hypothetical protein